MEIKLDNVFLCCMKEKIPTVLLYDGRKYLLQETEKENAIVDKTEDLRALMVERGNDEQLTALGKVVARVSGSLIHENPLNEMLVLKKQNRLSPLNMAKVLRKYHKDLKSSTIVVYRSGYQNFINKGKKADIRLNEPPKVYETVTEKNKETVRRILVLLGDSATFDEILKESNMSDYKLKLILKDQSMKIEQYIDDGKCKYRLIT